MPRRRVPRPRRPAPPALPPAYWLPQKPHRPCPWPTVRHAPPPQPPLCETPFRLQLSTHSATRGRPSPSQAVAAPPPPLPQLLPARDSRRRGRAGRPTLLAAARRVAAAAGPTVQCRPHHSAHQGTEPQHRHPASRGTLARPAGTTAHPRNRSDGRNDQMVSPPAATAVAAAAAAPAPPRPPYRSPRTMATTSRTASPPTVAPRATVMSRERPPRRPAMARTSTATLPSSRPPSRAATSTTGATEESPPSRPRPDGVADDADQTVPRRPRWVTTTTTVSANGWTRTAVGVSRTGATVDRAP
ncbi:hypothetical protein I4F81_002481 [Pyropia yezoensis]|uniref:Uncharacterized protein n=1 Tax=Pyropia yezoensis TaxID=2788 RepID=A0ACC3BPK9_PYRYE|nr:hypothetical protein I4F81_002481 [Neopyropia yezoensis]